MRKQESCLNCSHAFNDGSCFCETLEDDWTPTHAQMMMHEYQEKMALLDDVESDLDFEVLRPAGSDVSLVSNDERSERKVACRIGSDVEPSQTPD